MRLSCTLKNNNEMGKSRNLWNVRNSAQMIWFHEFRIEFSNLVKDESKIKESWKVFEDNLPRYPDFIGFGQSVKKNSYLLNHNAKSKDSKAKSFPTQPQIPCKNSFQKRLQDILQNDQVLDHKNLTESENFFSHL